MSWLRIFVLMLLVVPAVPAAPALAAPLMPSQAPTMEDVDPGIDHTGRDRDLPSEFRKQSVYYRTEQAPGTIIVNTADRHLYLIMGNGVAMRYGVGVGRDGFQWGGIQKITVKREWPDWVPPPEMIERQPYLPRWMAGGPGNPLGARAMNLGATVYRIHGTNAPETIGQAVSSGCFRLATTMSPIFTRACRSAPRSWCSINSATEDMLLSVLEFSERPLRGGLSFSLC
jgi:lipoprotein-anchoring transpeptidase ErfK/SrfK